jgi:O-methyltransferase involved in polyketide biosynthesis
LRLSRVDLGPEARSCSPMSARGIIDGTDCPEWMESFLTFGEKVGSHLLFGIGPAELDQYLADSGLKLIEDVGTAEYQELYLKPLSRVLNVSEAERAAYAEVVG